MATVRVPQPIADDPVETDPKHYKAEFENDQPSGSSHQVWTGRKISKHSHPESVVIFVRLRDYFVAFVASITSGVCSVPICCVLWSITPIRKSYLPRGRSISC